MKRQWMTLLVALLVMGPAGAGWAQKTVSETKVTKTSATIETIDSTNRLITLKGEDGNLETFEAGPEVKRFDALKVGDKVTFRYTESLAFDLRKPGDTSKGGSGGESVARGTGPKPKGTFFKMQTATVTVEAVDPKVPSISVRDADGDKVTHKVKEENRKALDGVKPGDRIDITYAETLVIEAEAPKAK